MTAQLPPVAVGLAVALLLAGAVFAMVQVWHPAAPRVASASTPSVYAGVSSGRLVAGIVVAFAVFVFSGWILLALFSGVLVVLWGRLLHDDRADDERRRIEGIAKWLEDLRDTLRGSSVGAEEALEHAASRPPASLQIPMRNFLIRRRQGFRTEAALGDLADELAHPTSDAAIAAIRLVIDGGAGAGRLHGTVQTLAAAARHEVTARERIDRTRAVYQHSMQRLVVIGAVLVAYLKIAGGDLLAPYDTAVGQMVLLLPLTMWVGCLLWLRSLCRYEVSRGARAQSPDAVRA